jgi:hypothetical protein
MKIFFRVSLLKLLTVSMVLTPGTFALSATKGKPVVADQKASTEAVTSSPEITAEQRQQMANMHEKMSTCLRSDKSMEDCHKEMMDSHKDFMGKGDSCPMHGMHGKGDSCCSGAGGKSSKKKGGSCAHHHGHHGHHGEKADAPSTENK